MANGYTCCIDTDRINGSIETISSIESCLRNVDLQGIILDIEIYIKNINFEHNNCVENYKDYINSILEGLEGIKRDMSELNTSLSNTVTKVSNMNEILEADLREIAKDYGDSPSTISIQEQMNLNMPIKVSHQASAFYENIDDSMKNFMVKTTLTDYPKEYSSIEEWKQSLRDHMSQESWSDAEREAAVEKTMAVWRQGQTGSKVTSLATSEYADHHSDMGLLSNQYKKELGLKNTTSTYTTIPLPEEPQEPVSEPINTVPIGLGIAASGITGAVGAVIASDIHDRKHPHWEEYKEEIIEEEKPILGEESTAYIPSDNVFGDPTPYKAARDQESIRKFYDNDNSPYIGEEHE